MTAKDDVTPYTVPFEERSGITTGDESYSNIARVKHDVFDDSYVGALVSDRRLGSGAGSNSTYGVDTRLRFRENYRFEAQVMGSHTKEPDDPSVTEDFDDIRFGDEKQYTSFFDGEKYDGYAAEANFIRSARHYNFNVFYENYSPTFRSDNGFIRSNNFQTLGLWNGYTFQFDEHPFLERLEPQFNWGRRVNHDGWFKDTWYQPSVWVRFKKQVSVWSGFIMSDERFAGERINGIRRLAVNLNTNFSSLLSGGFYVNGGHTLVRDRDDPRLGRQRVYEVWSTFQAHEPTATAHELHALRNERARHRRRGIQRLHPAQPPELPIHQEPVLPGRGRIRRLLQLLAGRPAPELQDQPLHGVFRRLVSQLPGVERRSRHWTRSRCRAPSIRRPTGCSSSSSSISSGYSLSPERTPHPTEKGAAKAAPFVVALILSGTYILSDSPTRQTSSPTDSPSIRGGLFVMTNGRFRIMLAHHRGPYKQSLVVAVMVLVALFVFFPPFEFQPYPLQADEEIVVVDVVPDIDIPPPPKDIPPPPHTRAGPGGWR